MNQNINLKTLKKLIISKIMVFVLSGAVTITYGKIIRNNIEKNRKYNTTYKTYNTLTDDTTLVKENEKGNEEEIIMKVYREDKDNTGTRIVDTYYLKKDEAYELMDYLNLKDDAIRFNTYTEEYHGTNEEYTEVSSVQNIEINDEQVSLCTFITAYFGGIITLFTYFGESYVTEGKYYGAYPTTLTGRIKLYNELKKEEEPKKKIKKL